MSRDDAEPQTERRFRVTLRGTAENVADATGRMTRGIHRSKAGYTIADDGPVRSAHSLPVGDDSPSLDTGPQWSPHPDISDRVPADSKWGKALVAVADLRAALAASPPAPDTRTEALDPEFYRDMGRIEATQRANEALAKIVAAAGGEVRVPDNLAVQDVTMSVDYLNGETIYRAAALFPSKEGPPNDR